MFRDSVLFSAEKRKKLLRCENIKNKVDIFDDFILLGQYSIHNK